VKALIEAGAVGDDTAGPVRTVVDVLAVIAVQTPCPDATKIFFFLFFLILLK
jgi:hypothetical protein